MKTAMKVLIRIVAVAFSLELVFQAGRASVKPAPVGISGPLHFIQEPPPAAIEIRNRTEEIYYIGIIDESDAPPVGTPLQTGWKYHVLHGGETLALNKSGERAK